MAEGVRFSTRLLKLPIGHKISGDTNTILSKPRPPIISHSATHQSLVAGIVSGLNLASCIGLFLTFGENLVFGMSPIVLVLLVVPIITSVLTLVLLVIAALAWKNGYRSILGRVHCTLITLVAIVFMIWANYWNMLGFWF